MEKENSRERKSEPCEKMKTYRTERRRRRRWSKL